MAEAIQADVVRLGERLPANERLGSKTEAGGGRRATMAGDDLDARSAGGQAVLDEMRIDDGGGLLEELSRLVRDSGSQDEARAVERITSRLDAWGIPYRVHTPELLVSLPRSASLTVDGVEIAAKKPSMSTSTGSDGL